MKFVVEPSLEHMALAKIAISLWNQKDVRALISKLSFDDLCSSGEWKKIEKRVTEKVPQISLPQLLEDKVLGVIKPIGLQISSLRQFHCTRFRLPVNLPAEFCWTPQGTVDRKRTAKVLVKDENLDILTRYKLACIYCVEDDIILFWNSMPEDLKESVSHRFPITNFWSHNMQKGGVGHISYKDIFYSSVSDSNIVAAKYFLQKLTPQEREESLEELAEDQVYVFCVLLPEMEEEEQKKVLKNNPLGVLQWFLQWPRQSFFIEIASSMWDFLSKDDYDIILRNIVMKIDDGYKDWNYQNLFTKFWQKSPSALKSFLTNEIGESLLLQYLFDTKDKENIRLIIKDTSLTAKKELIYSNDFNIFCKLSLRKNEWDFLEFFIQECSPSKNEMLKFKEEFDKRMVHSVHKEDFLKIKHKWDQLFPLSDDSICKYKQ